MPTAQQQPLGRILGIGFATVFTFYHFCTASACTRFCGDAHPYATYIKNR
jgi:hypothetical protein